MSAQQPALEMLDRMFADYFGVSPLAQSSDCSGQIFGGSRESSVYSTSQNTRTDSSRASTESTSPRTPAILPLEIASALYRGGANTNKTANEEPEKKVRMQNLLNSLAELYVTPTVSANVSNRDSTDGRTSAMAVQAHGEAIQRPVRSLLQPSRDLSPKSTCSDLHGNGNAGMAIHPGQSDRTSNSTLSTSQNNRSSRPTGTTPSSNVGARDTSIWPVDEANLYEVPQPEDVGDPMARRPSKVSTNNTQPMGPLTQIHYKVEAIPRRTCNDSDTRDELVRKFPQLCEAPHAVMYDDQGVALPPLKYEETTEKDRMARKNALAVHVRGKKMHTLIKSMVVLESRSSHWKKVRNHASKRNAGAGETSNAGASGMAQNSQQNSSRAVIRCLPEVPSPWSLNFMHSDTDTLGIKGTARRIFELSESRAYGKCPKCQGAGQEACPTCKGEQPDECFWCEGSGREKRKQHNKCQPCTGTGKLMCKACHGSLRSPCRTCDGEGLGDFCAYVQIKVRRVDFAPVPVTMIVTSDEAYAPEAVRAAAIERTWNSINKLTEASTSKHRHPFRPLAASCSCQTSWSDLVEVNVAQAVKTSSRSHTSHGLLKRSRSLNTLKASRSSRKAQTMRRFFVVPSDADLQPAEIDEDEFELALAPEVPAGSAQVNTITSRASGSHHRSMSYRIMRPSTQAESGSKAPAQSDSAQPGLQSIKSADVAAWQQQMHSMAPFNHMMLRPVSPTSQLGSLPGTPDDRHGTVWENGCFGSAGTTSAGRQAGGVDFAQLSLPTRRGESPVRQVGRPTPPPRSMLRQTFTSDVTGNVSAPEAAVQQQQQHPHASSSPRPDGNPSPHYIHGRHVRSLTAMAQMENAGNAF